MKAGFYFFVIRHDQRHGNRPYYYRLQHSVHCRTSQHIDTHPYALREQVATRKKQGIGFGRSPERLKLMVDLFREFRGCDESLIQETARPHGSLSTGFPRGLFSLYPTTRHCPTFEIDNGAAAVSPMLPLTGCTIHWRPLTTV